MPIILCLFKVLITLYYDDLMTLPELSVGHNKFTECLIADNKIKRKV